MRVLESISLYISGPYISHCSLLTQLWLWSGLCRPSLSPTTHHPAPFSSLCQRKISCLKILIKCACQCARFIQVAVGVLGATHARACMNKSQRSMTTSECSWYSSGRLGCRLHPFPANYRILVSLGTLGHEPKFLICAEISPGVGFEWNVPGVATVVGAFPLRLFPNPLRRENYVCWRGLAVVLLSLVCMWR